MSDAGRALPRNAWGHFSPDGREYVITDWRTPRPWANVVASPRAGLLVSQTGSGYSWIDNSQLAAIVRWQQDLAEDRSGRFLWARDLESGAIWSLAPAPCRPAYDRFACRHGIGYTTFATEIHDLAAEWTLFVDSAETVECWRLRLRDTAGRPRRILLVPFLEWNCGTSPAPRREFQKLFLETRFAPEARAILAGGHMWDVASRRWGHWNTSFPYWSAFAAAQPLSAATADKGELLGRYGDWAAPAGLASGRPWRQVFGRHHDPVAALACEVAVPAGGEADAGFVLATAERAEGATALARRFAAPAAMDASLAAAVAGWRERLGTHRIETPDPSLAALANDWLRYQAIAARLWGRAGYYQQSGAFGFRDQLQDSQVWLTIDPASCREQIRLHARHQFGDGSVVHWWHPLTEQGHVTRMTDDLLWLGFVVASYLKETGDFTVLDDREPFLERVGARDPADDSGPAPLLEHVARAFARVERRTSARGLPFIGEGDWNDGLSALGIEERGESVWLAEFLAGLYADWSEIHRRRGDAGLAAKLAARRERLLDAVNLHGWDGEGGWYRRATRDDGTWIGASGDRFGRIFLNPQTWAILADVAPPERAAACLAATRRHLISPAGALLLFPAWEEPDETVGYITRYAPGLRENGGVYTHAATWAIAAAAKVKDAELVATLLAAMDPTTKDPERYWAEPYVLPGNVDGPQSPYHGRAGWTWYTGAAAWLPRVVSEWVLGVRPTWEGLLFDPCLPPAWAHAKMTRPYRGATVEVEIAVEPARGASRATGSTRVEIDGRPSPDRLLHDPVAGSTHRVKVHVG